MKKIVFTSLIFLLAAVLVFSLWANFIFLNHRLYSRELEELDLHGQAVPGLWRVAGFYRLKWADLRGTGLSVEDYEYIRKALPQCTLLWDVPCLGSTWAVETEQLTVEHLTEADLHAMEYLPNLSLVDAQGCTDYALLAQLQLRKPDCRVLYAVPLAGEKRSSQAVQLELADADMAQVMEALPFLTRLRALSFTGALPTPQELAELEEAFPGLDISCTVGGITLPVGTDTEALNLSGVPVTLGDVEYLMECCPEVHRVELLDCGLTEGEMRRLCGAYPECFFLWELTVAGVKVRTDAEEMDLSWNRITDPAEVEELLPFFPKLEKVIMRQCGLDSPTMDALNRRHPDIRFVWTVHLGAVELRTDAIFFAPVVTGCSVTTADLDELIYCTDIIAVDIGHMPVTDCSWAAYMPNLQYLIIADTPISDISPLAGLKKLVFLEMFLTGVRDYSPLLTCTALEDLNLCFTYGPSEDVRKMTWLKRLWWDGNWTATRDLQADLPDTEINTTSGSSTGGTWRAGARYKEQRDILGMPYFYG